MAVNKRSAKYKAWVKGGNNGPPPGSTYKSDLDASANSNSRAARQYNRRVGAASKKRQATRAANKKGSRKAARGKKSGN